MHQGRRARCISRSPSNAPSQSSTYFWRAKGWHEHMIDPLLFENAREFRDWLKANAAVSTELIVAYRKIATGHPSMSYSESVDEALCFGWIDGVRRRIDDQTYAIRFTPRRPASIWSAVNIAKIKRLRAQGRMKPAGEKAFALRSKKKSAIYAHEQAVPTKLSLADVGIFKRNRRAWKFFEAAPPGYQKLALHWVTSAKKAETRASRLLKLIEACSIGERRF
jgi:uncharacterized protein YdeI (YjbR/CyaY-like superfamily)